MRKNVWKTWKTFLHASEKIRQTSLDCAKHIQSLPPLEMTEIFALQHSRNCSRITARKLTLSALFHGGIHKIRSERINKGLVEERGEHELFRQVEHNVLLEMQHANNGILHCRLENAARLLAPNIGSRHFASSRN